MIAMIVPHAIEFILDNKAAAPCDVRLFKSYNASLRQEWTADPPSFSNFLLLQHMLSRFIPSFSASADAT